MTVFKGFLIITKRNLLMVFMYLAIFLTIGILASGSDSNTSGTRFHAQALTVGVVDHDGGVLSKGLSTYLSQYHTVRQMPDDTAKLQDALFNRNVSYIVTIPKDFKVSCLRKHQALPVSKIPGSTDGYYVDQQINTYLNQARVLTDSGYSDKEAATYILKHADSSSHVTMLKSASSEKTPGYGYMYQYLPYVLISILCYVMGLIMIAFHQPDLQKRILCSAVSIRSQNLQLALGYLAVGCSVWMLTTW
ncbi:MAG: ABC transporter permease, partial [Dorea sp.]